MRSDLPLFFLLAYAITWIGVSPLVAAHFGRLGPVSPSLHALGALGPIGAALLVASRTHAHRQLIRSIFSRIPDWRWVLVAVGSPAALLLVSILGVVLVGHERLAWDHLAAQVVRPSWWGNLLVASVCYGFGEEPGWRGFALPRLQRRLPAWAATVILSLLWAGWHTPMFFYRFSFDGVGTVVGFFVALLAGAFWLTFLFNSTGGSVLAVALWHTLWNVTNLLAAELAAPMVAVLNAGMIVLGFTTLLAGPRQLSASGQRVQVSRPPAA
jgi:CAAX protease family protein